MKMDNGANAIIMAAITFVVLIIVGVNVIMPTIYNADQSNSTATAVAQPNFQTRIVINATYNLSTATVESITKLNGTLANGTQRTFVSGTFPAGDYARTGQAIVFHKAEISL